MRGTGSHYSGCLLTSPGPVLCILFEQVLITPAGNSSKNRTQQWLALHRFLRSSQRGVSGRLCTCPLPAPFSKMAQPQSLGGQGSCLSVTILSHTQHRPGDYGSFLPPFTQKFEWPWHCMNFSDPDLSWGRVGKGRGHHTKEVRLRTSESLQFNQPSKTVQAGGGLQGKPVSGYGRVSGELLLTSLYVFLFGNYRKPSCDPCC